MVLNPILGIQFIIAPIISLTIGYILTVIGFCSKVVLTVPWTTPPVLYGFLATGANIMGAVSQLIALLSSILCYVPFLLIYERQQNKNGT
jgi:cellobiose PTS system EIIC component